MSKKQLLKIRPYARLLNMLGDQLIKNERIALIELIKNSYDADASWVKVTFENFGEDFSINPKSKITVEDDGHGMSGQVIKKHWLNPATPDKRRRKEKKSLTRKGRVIQGDKGIGRFAILKLGRQIKITTKPERKNIEYIIDYDFGKYDEEFLRENGKEKDLFIDDLRVSLERQKPETIKKSLMYLGTRKVDREAKGTIIEISNLKGSWSQEKVKKVYSDIAKLESIFAKKITKSNSEKKSNEFDVYIFLNKTLLDYADQYLDKLNVILEDRSVFKVENGIYDELKKEIRFSLNGIPKKFKLNDPEISGLYVFKKYLKEINVNQDDWKTSCGSFNFGFYIFDFSSQAPDKLKLDSEDKRIIREHRIYLYRDGIRVYPYGEPEDDWLKIDTYRGTISAGDFLSNDQVVGHVDITQKENPKLKDKTNREGLIEEGNATSDLIALVQFVLAYIRQKPYAQYRLKLQDKKNQEVFKRGLVQEKLNELKLVLKDVPNARDLVADIEKKYSDLPPKLVPIPISQHRTNWRNPLAA